jgi:hypothetical protein
MSRYAHPDPTPTRTMSIELTCSRRTPLLLPRRNTSPVPVPLTSRPVWALTRRQFFVTLTLNTYIKRSEQNRRKLVMLCILA